MDTRPYKVKMQPGPGGQMQPVPSSIGMALGPSITRSSDPKPSGGMDPKFIKPLGAVNPESGKKK